MTTSNAGGHRRLFLLLRRIILPLLLACGVLGVPAAAHATTGVTTLCSSTTYSWLAGTGYTGQTVWGSWGPGHNCVSYAAYRLSQTGPKPWSGSIGDGSEWDENARAAGIAVNTTPAAGSIAQWDGGAGHVAYVEVVTATYIEVSEDNYQTSLAGYSSQRRLDRSGTTFQNAEFIHVRDRNTLGDFTGDGKADIAWYEQWQNKISVLASTGNGFAWSTGVTGIGGPTWAGVGDFTGDGKADIAWYEQWQNKISVLASTGNGFAWSTGVTGIGGPNWASVGDFTGDGKADIAWYEQWQNKISVLASTGNGFAWSTGVTGIGGPNWAGVGDFTGDGKADIAWYEQWQNKISVLASTGNGFAWSTGVTGIGGPTWASSAT